jgi:hypothetical protein
LRRPRWYSVAYLIREGWKKYGSKFSDLIFLRYVKKISKRIPQDMESRLLRAISSAQEGKHQILSNVEIMVDFTLNFFDLARDVRWNSG